MDVVSFLVAEGGKSQGKIGFDDGVLCRGVFEHQHTQGLAQSVDGSYRQPLQGTKNQLYDDKGQCPFHSTTSLRGVYNKTGYTAWPVEGNEMIGLLQRVTSASVEVDGEVVGSIGMGILVLVGFQAGDDEDLIPRFIERISTFRVFSDGQGKMNQSVVDQDGGILWVPQFTLAADTNSGRRPSFSSAAEPTRAKALFSILQSQAQDQHPTSAFGQFGAHMQVALTNNGPVTFWIEVN